MGKLGNKETTLTVRLEDSFYATLDEARKKETHVVSMSSYVRSRLAHSLKEAPVMSAALPSPADDHAAIISLQAAVKELQRQVQELRQDRAYTSL